MADKDERIVGELFIAHADKVERAGGRLLLCQGSDTQGAMAVIRHELASRNHGARPHYHKGYSEMLYIISGSLAVLGGEEVVVLNEGDLVVVPRFMVHAFSATLSSKAEYILVSTPGTDRFEYFRELDRLRAEGKPSPKSLQNTYDNHNVDSRIWSDYLVSQGMPL